MNDILSILNYNEYYKCYTAESCRATGLPMFGSKELSKEEYSKYANRWLSKTRCKQIKRPVVEGENPVAFFRVKNGYIPLFDRT